jgi:hypothetical protein
MKNVFAIIANFIFFISVSLELMIISTQNYNWDKAKNN